MTIFYKKPCYLYVSEYGDKDVRFFYSIYRKGLFWDTRVSKNKSYTETESEKILKYLNSNPDYKGIFG